jgi:hypothetical protein
MLKEHDNVRQIEGEPRRRWFSDDYIDLVVWSDDDGLPIGFQLCYDKYRNERALTWHQDRGWRHDRVSDGEDRFGSPKQSPVLVADGVCDYTALMQSIGSRCSEIEAEVVQFVLQKIAELQERQA